MSASDHSACILTTFDVSLQFHSCQHHSRDAGALNLDTLVASLGKAREICIASAYHDVVFCRRLLDPTCISRQLGRIRLVFNGLGGSRLRGQLKDLKKLQRQLQSVVPDTQIRLAFVDGIFHSKLFLWREAKRLMAWVGSANATMAAMQRNEEILLSLHDAPAVLKEYFHSVWDQARPLDDEALDRPAKSLTQFFRTGALYFKPSAQLPLTFNPFTALLGKLTDRQRRKLVDIRLPDSDPQPGVGPFNVKRALGLSDDDDEVEAVARTRIKRFAVETCYGYWVPAALTVALSKQLHAATDAKEKKLDRFQKAMNGVGKGGILTRYQKYVQAAEKMFAEREVSLPKELAGKPFEVPGAFNSFLDRLFANLESKDSRQRLCSPFIAGPMPEIWDDPLAYGEFRQSFFDYLQFINDHSTLKHQVPRRILDVIKAESYWSIPNIEAALTQHLKSKGWRDEDWSKAKR